MNSNVWKNLSLRLHCHNHFKNVEQVAAVYFSEAPEWNDVDDDTKTRLALLSDKDPGKFWYVRWTSCFVII